MGDFYPRATPTKLKFRNGSEAERNFQQQLIAETKEKFSDLLSQSFSLWALFRTSCFY